MFEHSTDPRLYGVAPGHDFPKALVDGLLSRMEGRPPEDLAKVELIVNTRRMQRRIVDLFDQGPAVLLPQIKLLTDLADVSMLDEIQPAVSPLRRRLELVPLITKLIESDTSLSARTSAFDLADSLATLMDEMNGEGVPPSVIKSLDVSDQSGHWARALTFIDIVQRYFGDTDEAPDKESRQRKVIETLTARWTETPPEHPVIVAGSTGSRGATMALMQAVAKLPQGAVILPGFDSDVPSSVWAELQDPMTSEDHPQYRFAKLVTLMGVDRDCIQNWLETASPVSGRNKIISLSLRPAPVTDAWLDEGPNLENLEQAMGPVTLVEAPNPRTEAMAIAMRLRQAAEDGQSAALITPDRMLTRRVTAALDRWGILPDDSAGIPLQLSPPGRFLRHVANLLTDELTVEHLLTLLRHPLSHSQDDRNDHLRFTSDLELYLRKEMIPFPTQDVLKGWAMLNPSPERSAWVDWLCTHLTNVKTSGMQPLESWVALVRSLSETIAGGGVPNQSGELWLKDAGKEALRIMADFETQAVFGGDTTASDFVGLLGSVLSGGEVRNEFAPHPNIMIWGTLEARVQGADLLILGGLNEGTWPEAPKPDPWLNRTMRNEAGLLLPERRIGLSAHDYQQAVAAPEVWLSRSIRSDDAETVASRWLNRLTNLLSGLPSLDGPKVLESMIQRGNDWIAKVQALEEVTSVQAAQRPSPQPPVAMRPRKLSVTEISTLIRDPYAIYAKHILRLKPLNAIQQPPDARRKGILVHSVLEEFVKQASSDHSKLTRQNLLQVMERQLEDQVPWPATRIKWLSDMERVADWFVEGERQRLSEGHPIATENAAVGDIEVGTTGYRLRVRADRIDRNTEGDVVLYDYKTGTPPSRRQQRNFDKQLLIEAAMMERGGFKAVGKSSVSHAAFVGVGRTPSIVEAPFEAKGSAEIRDDVGETPDETWARLQLLLNSYLNPETGFTARLMMERDAYGSDYDSLSRYGEWDATFEVSPEDLT
jgi:double-strand break repair protein AddB